jgi:MscS family membrane protein
MPFEQVDHGRVAVLLPAFIVHEHGAEFAFPTRTLHLVSQNDDGPATGLEDNNPEDAQHVQR